MAPRTYTRRVVAVELPGDNAFGVVYTNSEAGAVILRDIVVTNTSTAAIGRFDLWVNPFVKSGVFALLVIRPLPVGTTHVDVRQELLAGESLLALTDAPGVYLAITAYVFSS